MKTEKEESANIPVSNKCVKHAVLSWIDNDGTRNDASVDFVDLETIRIDGVEWVRGWRRLCNERPTCNDENKKDKIAKYHNIFTLVVALISAAIAFLLSGEIGSCVCCLVLAVINVLVFIISERIASK